MSTVLEYVRLAAEGLGRFITDYKLLAVVLTVLLYTIAGRKRRENAEEKVRVCERGFTMYTLLMTAAVMVPVTAAVLLIYQTRFYDYEWLWSMVPLTAVAAWGITLVITEELAGKLRGKSSTGTDGKGSACAEGKSHAGEPHKWKIYSVGILTATAVLFLCGNLGGLQNVSDEELELRQDAREILEYIEENAAEGNDLDGDCMIWGRKEIIEEIRLSSGEIKLYYGKDMWDAKSGAYDYEPYSEEVTRAYGWMELLSADRSLFLLEVNVLSEELSLALGEAAYLDLALEDGVDIIILPTPVTKWMERKMNTLAQRKGLTVTAQEVEEYTLWMFE